MHELIAKLDKSQISDPKYLERVAVPTIGVASNEFDFQQSTFHRPYMGHGMQIWQSPKQYAHYLSHVVKLPIDCYVEFGVYRGGTFISTRDIYNLHNDTNVEAHAIDVEIHGTMLTDYVNSEDNVYHHVWDASEIRQRTIELLIELNKKYTNIFLLIDGNHEYDFVSKDYDALAPYVKYIAMHDITNTAVPGVSQKWNEIKKAESFEAVYEFTYQYPEFQDQPYFGLGVLARPTNDVNIFVLHHDQSLLDGIPDLPQVTKVNLDNLDIGIYQNNQLAEFRFYMSVDEAVVSEHEFCGFMTGRWNEKYSSKKNRLETLHNLNMIPNVVWVSHLAESQWQNWISQFGGSELFKELEEYNGMRRQFDQPFVWSGNFICHRKVAREVVSFLQKNIKYVVEKYGYDIPWVHPTESERKRNMGFLIESLLILYFNNRKDLTFKEIP